MSKVVNIKWEIKTSTDIEEFGWTFDVGYNLQEEQMRRMGLYISDPLSNNETDRRFAEPGVFCIKPDGTTQIVAISNGPAARPDLDELLDGMVFTIDGDPFCDDWCKRINSPRCYGCQNA